MGNCHEVTEGVLTCFIYNPSVSLSLNTSPCTGEAFLIFPLHSSKSAPIPAHPKIHTKSVKNHRYRFPLPDGDFRKH